MLVENIISVGATTFILKAHLKRILQFWLWELFINAGGLKEVCWLNFSHPFNFLLNPFWTLGTWNKVTILSRWMLDVPYANFCDNCYFYPFVEAPHTYVSLFRDPGYLFKYVWHCLKGHVLYITFVYCQYPHLFCILLSNIHWIWVTANNLISFAYS